jgi:hypothetical protein
MDRTNVTTSRRTKCIRVSRSALLLFSTIISASVLAGSQTTISPIDFEVDAPASIRFFGSSTADLFTREIDESFRGVLQKNFVEKASNGFPAGFVNASPAGQPWAGTMWTRDSGTYLRELAMRGYYAHASLLAECLMNQVEKNEAGFYSFPRFFRGSKAASGTEVDGTASIIIGMVLLWERLPGGNPTRDHIRAFLFQDGSPISYFTYLLQSEPLVAGTGEFGCGMKIQGECYNVVQNDLVMLALLSASNMAAQVGSEDIAGTYRALATKLWEGMKKYLVDQDGSWIWCIDVKTLKPNPSVLNAKVNRGFGGINGLGSMYADVLGFQPLASTWKDADHNEKTLNRLYQTPSRKLQFDRYGIWTQFDALAAGLLSSPSYGQGYAIQAMLLDDKMAMADKALSFLVNATYRPIPEYKLARDSPYYFYERLYSSDAVGQVPLEVGCGALNLVNVTEPLKISRILLGVDDSSLRQVTIVPRIPSGWQGVEAHNWPIRTSHGVVRADLVFEKKGNGYELALTLAKGEVIDDLKVRIPSANGFVWREQKHASSVRFRTP